MKKKETRGRKPLVLTDEMEARFLKAIRLGCPIKDACGCAGFSTDWYYQSKRDVTKSPGTARNKRFAVFTQRLKEAEGEATQRWLAIIEKAAHDGSWQAAAWKLERRRDMFIPKVRQEVTGKDGEAIKIASEASSARDIIEAAIARHAPAEGIVNGSGETDPRTTH